ncbi:MAG: 1-acyl-sn-glycerol-3-phosphate acyltransferase, partial [Candidatus Acidiferrales bacterium]
PFTVGARVVFLETLGATELLQALREREATLFACVPQFFYLIHDRVERELAARSWPARTAFRGLLRLNGALRSAGINLGPVFFRPVHRTLGHRMRLLITGGSRFDDAVGRDFYRMGFDLLQAYGLTETSGAATVMRPGKPWTGSVGPALPGVEIKILPRQAEAGEAAADGEVLIRGPIVMEGYYNRPEVNAEVLPDGWLHTGDLGRLDRRGNLFITGRKTEIIVTSGGKNLYPEEIETHYRQSPFIKDICVVGVSPPGERAAERLHAVVVPDFELLRQRKIVNVREMIRFEIEGLSIHLPSYKRVLGFEIWTDDLPRTTTRKLKRFEIERSVRAGAGAPAAAAETELSPADAAWASEPDVASALALIAEAARRQPPLQPEANLDLDLGLDSMQRVELITRLEQSFGLALPESAATEVYTVRELVEAFRAGGRGAAAPSAEGDSWARLLASAAPPDAEVRELFRPRRIVTLLLFVLLKLAYALAWVFLRFRVSGRRHLPAAGPFVLSPNHQSYIDPFLLTAALPYRLVRNVFFVGASEFFESPLMRFLARMVRLVPVDPDRNLVRAMQAGACGLRQGGVLVLFPEGERSPDGIPRRFKKGASILSLHLQVPIVPVGLDGAFDVWPRGKSPQRLAPVRMRFGPPLPPPEPLPQPASVKDSEARYASAAEQLRHAVVELWESLRPAGAHTA